MHGTVRNTVNVTTLKLWLSVYTHMLSKCWCFSIKIKWILSSSYIVTIKENARSDIGNQKWVWLIWVCRSQKKINWTIASHVICLHTFKKKKKYCDKVMLWMERFVMIVSAKLFTINWRWLYSVPMFLMGRIWVRYSLISVWVTLLNFVQFAIKENCCPC